MHDVPFVPGVYLKKLIDLMEEENLPVKHIVRECGIDFNSIGFGTYVSNNQMQAVIRHYLKLTSEKNPGVRYGSKLDALMHGFLGSIYMFRGKPYELIKNVIGYMNVRLPILKMGIVVEKDFVAIQFNTKLVPDDLKNFMLQSYIASAYKLGSMILPKLQVHASPHLFNQITSVSDIFQNNIVVTEDGVDELRYTIKSSEFVRSQTLSVEEESQPSDTPALVLKLRQYLIRNNEELISAEQVASDLGMSVRTLRRKLSECGYSFRSIRQEMLMNTATRYLQNSTLSIDRIAEKCGYSDQASFSRAFQKWQGDTPDAIRRQGRTQSPSKS